MPKHRLTMAGIHFLYLLTTPLTSLKKYSVWSWIITPRFLLFASKSINDFQVSGPQNMSKAFEDGENGKAEVTLTWTPQHSDLSRFVPVCFTAETNEA